MKPITAVSACPLDCFGTCSLKVTAENNVIVAIEPNTENPVTGMLICSKGRNHVKRINHPDRLLEPLRKTANGWEPLSWDEAFDFIAGRINDCLATYGHQSIAHFLGGGAAGKLKSVPELFFRHLGGGTVFAGGLCWSAGIKAQRLDFGKALSHSPQDLLNARSLVLWGKNPADTHFHLLSWITKVRKQGCPVILVDPFASPSAGFADHVIRPLPGTDWALAVLVIQDILASNQGDLEAVASVNSTEPLLLKQIESFDRMRLLDFCDVSCQDVSLLADAYGLNTPCSTYIGYGLQRCETGGAAVRLIDLLAYVSGQVGIPGGGANYANQVNSSLFDWSWAEPENPVIERVFQQGTMGADILSSQEPPIKMFFIACANPAVQVTDTTLLAKALSSIETVVVIDHFMTDTAQMADIVLPATYFLEDEDIITSGMWNGTIHYAPAVVPPKGASRSELRIFSELASRLNLKGFPQLSEAQWIKRILRPLADQNISYEELKKKGWIPSPIQELVPWKDHEFMTETRAFTPLSTETLKHLAEIHCADNADGTLAFISIHSRDSINSQHTMDKEKTLPEVQIHTDTAMLYNIASGDRICLTSLTGHIEALVRIDDAIRPGVVASRAGNWKYQNQCINDLAPAGVSDIGGQALINGARVKISKS